MKLEVHHIRALKGRQQLVELNVTGPEQARAAELAGVEIIVSGRANERAAIRAAAPSTHFTFGLIYGRHVNTDEAKRAAFEALDAGADSIYCAMHFDVVEAMAKEGIPVVGHVGLVPQKARLTGFRGFGKSFAEARDIMQAVRRYEEAGAFAVEMEVVAAPVASAIAAATPLTVISMGSGGGCDVQYLFAVDVLGETTSRRPRHARAYEHLGEEYQRLQDRRVAAFSAFRADVAQGQFPAPSELVALPEQELDAFRDWLVLPPHR